MCSVPRDLYTAEYTGPCLCGELNEDRTPSFSSRKRGVVHLVTGPYLLWVLSNNFSLDLHNKSTLNLNEPNSSSLNIFKQIQIKLDEMKVSYWGIFSLFYLKPTEALRKQKMKLMKRTFSNLYRNLKIIWYSLTSMGSPLRYHLTFALGSDTKHSKTASFLLVTEYFSGSFCVKKYSGSLAKK